jgi:TIR domain
MALMNAFARFASSKSMAKIFISYAAPDRNFAQQLGEKLRAFGHDIYSDFESLAPGSEWRSDLARGLRESDVFVVLFSQATQTSKFVFHEIGAARAYASESERMLIIPVVIDEGVTIPTVLQDIQFLFQADRNVDAVVDGIERAMAAFVGRRTAKEERAVEVAQKIEKNAAIFIDDAVLAQTIAERRNRRAGIIWYVSGFLSLVAGLLFATLAIVYAASTTDKNWIYLTESILRSVIVIGFLAACARYSFALGKSYISEALKCSDRIHAIAFGKFYLQAYGEKATWPELKEVFQHWNIDRSSTFSSLDVSEIDPQILSILGSVASAALGKNKKK